MKIAFVLDDSLDKADGVQQYVLTLGSYFRTKGHSVHYIVGSTERNDLPNVHSVSRNLQVHFNQNRMSTPLPANNKKLKELLDQEKFDVLHVQMPYSPLMAGRVIKNASRSTAIIGTFHIVPYSFIETGASRLLGIMLKRSARRFNAIYSVSQPAKRFAEKSFKWHSAVLPNAVNVTRYASAQPLREYDDDTVTIVFVGRLVERKGCMHLLRAVQKLHEQKKLDRVRVIICGKGPLNKSLRRFTAVNQLQHVVRFLGFVDEDKKAKILASADIAVFPSTGGESFGIVLIEAMAAGSSVVLAGDNIGYASVMGRQSGQLFDPTNTEKFVKVLSHYIRSKAARMKARRHQQQLIQQFDVRIVGDTLLKDYESHIYENLT